MKITIAYIPEEEREATADLEELRRHHPAARVHESDRHPPFKHIYLTTKKPEKPSGTKKNACTIPPDVI